MCLVRLVAHWADFYPDNSDNFNSWVNASGSAMPHRDRQVCQTLTSLRATVLYSLTSSPVVKKQLTCSVRSFRFMQVWKDNINSPGSRSSLYLGHPCYELMGKYLRIFSRWRYQYQPGGPTRKKNISYRPSPEAKCHWSQYYGSHMGLLVL